MALVPVPGPADCHLRRPLWPDGGRLHLRTDALGRTGTADLLVCGRAGIFPLTPRPGRSRYRPACADNAAIAGLFPVPQSPFACRGQLDPTGPPGDDPGGHELAVAVS